MDWGFPISAITMGRFDARYPQRRQFFVLPVAQLVDRVFHRTACAGKVPFRHGHFRVARDTQDPREVQSCHLNNQIFRLPHFLYPA